MDTKIRFIAVGENIHCTRIFKVGGRYAKTLADGSAVINFSTEGSEKVLPIPESFTKSAEWQSGKVKHTAVAVWQGLYGNEEGKKAAHEYIRYMVKRQEECGANFLDVNVDEFSVKPEECGKAMRWITESVQEFAAVPLSIDSSNPETLEIGLTGVKPSLGTPMVNSVSLERQDAIQIAGNAGAVVIAGATGKEKMPDSKESRIANIDTLMDHLVSAGFSPEEIYIDPLVFPVSVDPNNGVAVLDAIQAIRESYGEKIHFAPGLSNVSFGMPNRKLLNQVFTYLCIERGLDGGIVDPVQINESVLNGLDPENRAFQIAGDFLLGKDMFGKNYIAAVRGGEI